MRSRRARSGVSMKPTVRFTPPLAPIASHVESESLALVPLRHFVFLEARRPVVGILLDRVGGGARPLGARQVPRRTSNDGRFRHDSLL